MTTIKTGRLIARETAVRYRGHALIIELHPGYMILRQKGWQYRVSLDYAAAFEAAMKIEARRA